MSHVLLFHILKSHMCRLPVARGEPWQQAGEDLHKRLTSPQADAAAEALRARVAHFMAAQQAAGQPQMGNLGSSQACPWSHPAAA